MTAKNFSTEIRRATLRCLHSQGSGHVGGSLSVADALAVLYTHHMDVDPQNPKRPNRDMLVLSKGHAGPAWYATLALKGFFPMDWLDTLNKIGTKLPSHANLTLTPGVDMTAGSLGQGLSCACGLALGLKAQGDTSHFVYVITGDGELQEGQNWEGAMFASHHKLDNVVVLVDNNKLQIDGETQNVCKMEDLEAKFRAFGFETTRVDGHDHQALHQAICNAKVRNGVPHCIVMDTIKGKGVSIYEQMGASNHSTTVNDEQYALALSELQ